MAATITNFVGQTQGTVFAALLPASAVLNARRDAQKLGKLLTLSTRYGMLLLLAMGLPLIIIGGPILRLWVGKDYALHSLLIMQVLVVANVVRLSALPYHAALGDQSATKSDSIAARRRHNQPRGKRGWSLPVRRHWCGHRNVNRRFCRRRIASGAQYAANHSHRCRSIRACQTGPTAASLVCAAPLAFLAIIRIVIRSASIGALSLFYRQRYAGHRVFVLELWPHEF